MPGDEIDMAVEDEDRRLAENLRVMIVENTAATITGAMVASV